MVVLNIFSGTHLYMSPEQLEGRNYSYKVDVWSLGIIFFELLVSFATEMERINTLTKIRKQDYPPAFVKSFTKEVIHFSKTFQFCITTYF